MSALDKFKKTPFGRRLRAVIEDSTNVGDMLAFSRGGIPAVQVIGQQVERLGREARDDTVKQMVGRWVREVVEAEGMVPVRTGRVAPGNLFSTGMIYGPRSPK